MHVSRTIRSAAVAALFACAVGGCETLNVTDFNNPGLDELTETPSRSTILNAAQGLMVGARLGIGEFNRYISAVGVLGRESYIFDPSDPRFVTELLQGPLDPAGASFGGGGHWADRYRNIRAAHVLLDALERATDFFSTEELEAIRGWAKTIMAHDFLLVVNTRDDFGAPIDVNRDPTGEPAPIASKDEVLDHIVDLLEEAAVHLAGGGSAFPFELSSGFTRDGFGTPGSFLEFNRALLARVYVYREQWGMALTALSESFLDDGAQTVADLETGVYHAYSAGPGDRTNDLAARRDVLPAHPSIATDAQAGDQRLVRKTELLADPIEDPGMFVTSDRLFTRYAGVAAPIPFIRNEELILLRAEARLQSDQLEPARSDINLVRGVSGELAPIDATTWANMTADERIDELLYNRRYSLLFEGHRWIDLRRYDRLDQLPVDHPTFVRFRQFPLPEAECVPRTPRPDGCSQIQGF